MKTPSVGTSLGHNPPILEQCLGSRKRWNVRECPFNRWTASGRLQLLTRIGKRHSPLKLVSDSPVLCTNYMDFLHKLLFKAWAIFILERQEHVSSGTLFISYSMLMTSLPSKWPAFLPWCSVTALESEKQEKAACTIAYKCRTGLPSMKSRVIHNKTQLCLWVAGISASTSTSRS
jgi:hypothetical protein